MLILELLVFAIPVTIAAILHMVVVRFNLFAFLKTPLDLGRSINGKRIFGDNKTLRGLIVMIIFSMISTYFLYYLLQISDRINQLNILDFNSYSPFFLGGLFGLAYVLAELPNSFVKRQVGIKQGKRGSVLNVLIDQFDSPFLCLLVMIPFSSMSMDFFIFGSLFYLGLHLFFNLVLYLVGLRKNPF